MSPERHQRPAPRERTFAQVFPWRNLIRALMLVLLILAVVVIKRSTGPLLARIGEMWGPPSPPAAAPRAPAPRRLVPAGEGYHIRLAPGLAPPVPGRDVR